MISKNPNKPLVSVILPVYKSEAYLEACLNSLRNQTYENIEIVAVVDYLGDNSLKILRKYKKIDKRIRVYNNLQRYGLASTLNRAVRLSKGEFLALMDATAIADRNRIAKQARFLRKHPKVGAVGSQIAQITEKNRKIGSSVFPLLHDEIYKHLIGSESFKFESAMIAKTRLPKDLIKFDRDTAYPFIFAQVFLKIGAYKELANLEDSLLRVREFSNQKKKLIRIDKKLSFIKVLFEGATIYEYKPSLRALFSPIIKQI
jgi:glycosyltransferase involved in cell wall biosynthesis